MPVLYTNNATSTLSAGITAGDTSLTVASGQGARFPAPTGADYFYATLINSAGSIEIIKVTARTTDTLTVTRAQDSTTAAAWLAGDRIEVRVTKAMLDDLKGERAARSGDTFSGQVKVDSTGASTVFSINGSTSSGFITHLVTNSSTFSNDNGATSGALFGALSQPTISNSGAGGANGNAAWGGYFAPQIASSGATAPVVTYGVQGFSERAYAADVSTSASNALFGGFFTARHTTAIADTTSSASLTAVTGSTLIQGGIATNAYGLFATGSVGSSAIANNTVTVTNYHQFFGNAVAVGSAANSYGTITNYYGLYLSAPTVNARGTITNRWGLYQVDTAASNYLGGNLALGGGLREARVTMAASDININAGNYFTRTISGATTLTVSNVPAAGTAASFILDLTNGGSATITWWSGMKWAGGTAPTLTSAGRDVLGFFTHDGGTTWSGLLLGKDVK